MNTKRTTEETDEIQSFCFSEVTECSYLPDQYERLIIAQPEPGKKIGKKLTSILSRSGFRRSGLVNYRPCCIGCSACHSYRVSTEHFNPNRSQNRCLKKNSDIVVRVLPAKTSKEHYELFRHYLQIRHQNSVMEQMSLNDYETLILNSTTESVLLEFRDVDQKLLMVAVTDILDDGLSACYTFFDPREVKRSLGTLGILTQIRLAKKFSLPWVYLGYWVPGSSSMNYKKHFRPGEVFINERWLDIESALEL